MNSKIAVAVGTVWVVTVVRETWGGMGVYFILSSLVRRKSGQELEQQPRPSTLHWLAPPGPASFYHPGPHAQGQCLLVSWTSLHQL